MTRRALLMMAGLVAACGGKRTGAADDASFDLAFAAPATAKTVTVPLIEIVPADTYADKADGAEVPDVPGKGELSIVRDLGGVKRLCKIASHTKGGQAKGRATCLHARIEGDRLIVPFAYPIMDGWISADDVHAELFISGTPPASAKAMTIGGHSFACGYDHDDVPALVTSAATLCASLRAP